MMRTHPARVALATVAALVVVGCGGGDGNGSADARPTDNFDRRALLRNLADNVIVPALTELSSASATMSTAVTAYCGALGTGTEAQAQATAQDAWRATASALQQAEMMRLGPAADNDNTLRDTLYSWPLVSSCAIDQEVKSYYDDPAGYDITTVLTNRRGMFALEYTLFAASLDHTCDVPVAPPGWDALTDDQRKAARCGYAERAAADVDATAATLHSAWTGGFADDLASAGQGGTFDSAQAALNVVSDAMFYLDFEVKDFKVGESTGIVENLCAVIGSACLAERESQFADHSKENIVANLRAFDAMFHGGTGIGFDDMLIELGADALATQMSADITAMVAAAEAVPGTWRSALENSYADCAATHAAIKVVTDNLKSQFLTVLGLDFPDNLPTDND